MRSLRDQLVGVELHVVQHLAHRVALDDGVEHDVAVLVEADVDGVGVAEQVVQVAEDLLVRAEQERAEVVRLAVEGVQLQRAACTSRRSMNWSILPSESQVMSPSTAWRVGGSFEPVDRHDREELLDRPAVGHRLEDREVAEVGVRQRLVEALQLLGHVVQLADHLLQLAADRPEQPLGHAPLLERQVAEVEQVQRLVDRLLRRRGSSRASSSSSGRGRCRSRSTIGCGACRRAVVGGTS